jgi:Thaumatin family
VVAIALLALVCGSSTASAAGTHTITLVNHTEETIWPAATPGSISGQTGWTLLPGASLSFRVPKGWNARLWGRTGCHFGSAGEGGCRTGDCDGRYECKGWGTIPATLAEYDMNSFDGLDFYDVSMVDGSNLPMYINVTHGEADRKVNAEGCLDGKCTTEVHCPAALRVPRGSSEPVGCISPCARFGTDRYCCAGPYAEGCDPATTWPIDYAKVFKRAEPYAYSWSGDDRTSVFTCKGDCDYRIVFGVTPPAVGGPPG